MTMRQLTIEDIEEIEGRRNDAVRQKSRDEYVTLTVLDIPRLIADNKRLRLELNKLAGAATKAVS